MTFLVDLGKLPLIKILTVFAVSSELTNGGGGGYLRTWSKYVLLVAGLLCRSSGLLPDPGSESVSSLLILRVFGICMKLVRNQSSQISCTGGQYTTMKSLRQLHKDDTHEVLLQYWSKSLIVCI